MAGWQKQSMPNDSRACLSYLSILGSCYVATVLAILRQPTVISFSSSHYLICKRWHYSENSIPYPGTVSPHFPSFTSSDIVKCGGSSLCQIKVPTSPYPETHTAASPWPRRPSTRSTAQRFVCTSTNVSLGKGSLPNPFAIFMSHFYS